MKTPARTQHGWIKPPGPVADGLRIGLLGGSFNPAHEGHLHISDMAMKRLGLDYVWWLVSPQNPLKPTIGMAPLSDRLAYAAAKFENRPRVFVVDLERELRTRYSIDTITRLQRRFPRVQFVWIMGSDNLMSFPRWRRWQDIVKRIPIAVVLRPGSTMAPLQAKAARGGWQRIAATTRLRQKGKPDLPCFTIIDGQRNPLSSTQIRGKPSWAELLVRAIPA